MILRPMHACSETLTLDRLDEITYPKWVSDKEDGYRCMLACRGGKCAPFTRKGLIFPNFHVQEWAERQGIAGLDGEIILPGQSFHDVQSFCSSAITLPKPFKFMVFDWHLPLTVVQMGYLQRLQIIKSKLDMYDPAHTEMLRVTRVDSPSELEEAFNDAVARGKEGLIVRSGDGPYKRGRSTWIEQYALKMKKLEENAAQIIGFEEAMANENELERDNFGLAKRSSRMVNKRGKDTLGALICLSPEKVQFNIGSGWDRKLGDSIWRNKRQWRGRWIIYKSHAHGVKEKPRQPIYKGILNA